MIGPRGWVEVANGPFDDADDLDVDDDAGGADLADRSDTAADPDVQWRRSAGQSSGPQPGERCEATDARSTVDPDRIVLTHEASTSVWARPHDGSAPEFALAPADTARDSDERGDEGSTPEFALAPASEGSGDGTHTDIDADDGSPEHDDEAPPRRRIGRRSALIAVVAIVAVIAVTAAAVVVPVARDEDAAPVPISALELPDGAQVRWTSRVDGVVETVAADDRLVVVASADELTVLAGADGQVVWRRVNAADAGEIERVAVIGGRVVAMQQTSVGTTEVRVFDPDTGTELWRTRGRDGTYSIAGAGHDPVIVGRTRVDRGTVLSVLDPADGSAVGEPVTLSGVEAVGNHFAVAPTERQVAVWSTDEFGVVAGPVDEFNLRTVAELDGAVVALDLEGRIVAFDAEGRRSDELVLVGTQESVDGGASIASVDLVGVTTAGTGIVSGESSLGFTVVDGRIETMWERSGFAAEPVATSVGERNVLVSQVGNGEIVESILESETGAIVMPIDGPGPRERLSTLAWNGYVVSPTVGARERVVVATDYDGRQLWSLQLSPEADYAVTSGGIVVVEPTSGGTDVSFAR